ncbi:MAG: complex I NDUFA9 subunit family protein [Alphaproteobacteria bacterium]|nr:complex I NDUFA9 subunit family protein [Alphaproteobacteria bacterium]
MADRIVTVFGGSGFLGRHAVRQLAAKGTRLRIAVRDPEAAAFLKPLGDVGQIVPLQTNVRDDASVARAIDGADAVINLVGLLYESGRQTFQAVHVEGARRIAQAARQAKVRSLIQISAIGADPDSPARYARTKAEGEAAVREAFPKTVLLRPSVVFGPEDNFFNRFASLACLAPALPLIGGGKTRMQPVYVLDIAKAIAGVLDGHAGETFELGGPQVFTFRELMERMLETIERRRLLVPVPFWAARLGAFFLEILPRPLLTRDQVRLLERDNVVGRNVKTFADLGITPTPLAAVLPDDLARFCPGGRRRTFNLA